MLFIGRIEELSRVGEVLAQDGVLTLVGPSGVGKTRVAERYLEGRPSLTVDCFSRSEEEIVGAMANALDLPTGASVSDSWGLAATALENVQVLFLDDVSVELSASVLRDLLPCEVLMTSHFPQPGLPTLPIETWSVGELDGFADSEALELFVAAARAEDVTFALKDDDIKHVHQVAKAMNGHPLGISLAGRRAASAGALGVLDLLEQPTLLADGSRPTRHQTLRAALEFSWQRLGLADQRRLFVMSQFRRPLRVTALAELCEDDPGETSEAVHLLARSGYVTRGRFPRVTESFIGVTERLFTADRPDEGARLTGRIVSTAVELARAVPKGLVKTPLLGEGPSFWQFVFEREGAGLPPDQLGAVVAAWCRWMAQRHGSESTPIERRDRFETLLRLADSCDAFLQAASLVGLADCELALEYLDLAYDRAEGDAEVHAVWVARAWVFTTLFRLEEALAALETAAEVGEPSNRMLTLGTQVLVMLERQDEARVWLGRALADPNQTALECADIAGLRVLLEDHPDPPSLLEESARIAAEHGYLRKQASLNISRAVYAGREERDLEAAIGFFADARAKARRLDHRLRASVDLMEAVLRLHHGDFDGATQLLAPTTRAATPLATRGELVLLTARWQRGEAIAEEWSEERERWRVVGEQFAADVWRLIDVSLAQGTERRRLVREHLKSSPSIADSMNAVAALGKLHPSSTMSEHLAAWGQISPLLSSDDFQDLTAQQAKLYVEARLPPQIANLRELERVNADVVIDEGFGLYFVDGKWAELTPTGATLLRALVEADGPLDHAELGAAVYPDEFVAEEALANRLNVQVTNLRNAGLKRYLAKRREGFVLEGTAQVGGG